MATTWSALSAAQFMTEGGLTADELTKLNAAAGGDCGLTEILASAVAEWRGVLSAAGYEVDATSATSIPPSCRRHIIAQVRWQVLIKFPALRQMQTEERKVAKDEAKEKLKSIEEGDAAVEPGTTTTETSSGNWGSQVKINMRTHDSTED